MRNILTIRVRRHAFLLGILVGTLFGALLFAPRGNSTQNNHHRHLCYAPCVVILPPNTLEDEFGINYGWADNMPIVDVYRKGRR